MLTVILVAVLCIMIFLVTMIAILLSILLYRRSVVVFLHVFNGRAGLHKIREILGSNPGQGRNLIRDFCSPCDPSQLSYDEYTPHTVSGRGWLSGDCRCLRCGRSLVRLHL